VCSLRARRCDQGEAAGTGWYCAVQGGTGRSRGQVSRHGLRSARRRAVCGACNSAWRAVHCCAYRICATMRNHARARMQRTIERVSSRESRLRRRALRQCLSSRVAANVAAVASSLNTKAELVAAEMNAIVGHTGAVDDGRRRRVPRQPRRGAHDHRNRARCTSACDRTGLFLKHL
jgi:hypothetical protein